MTPEEGNKRIAEACGEVEKCKECDGYGYITGQAHASDCHGECHNCPVPVQEMCSVCGGCGLNGMPCRNYHGDLNAMHEAEKVLFTKNDWSPSRYEELLDDVTMNWAWKATAPQRWEAFLRTIGQWEGE